MNRRRAWLVAVLVALAVGAAEAQVGHEPRNSPYRDITKGMALTVTTGYFGGSGGSLGVGPHNGTTLGGRFDIRLSNTFQFGFSGTVADLERNIVILESDTTLTLRTLGPVPQQVLMFDVSAQLNLTGGKSWNRLAPYFAGVIGLAIAENTPADNSGFSFGNKIYLTPTLGTRVIITQAIQLRFEARANFWKLSYPPLFQAANPSTGQWVISPWFMAGLGIAF
jgi:hypothetical protein